MDTQSVVHVGERLAKLAFIGPESGEKRKKRGDDDEEEHGAALGRGKITYSNGDQFEGEFFSCYPKKGTMIYGNGDRYEGEFMDNKPNGQGKMTFASGSVKEGEFKNGKLNGKGTLKMSCKSNVIEGEFLDDQPVSGIFKFANGDVEPI